MSNSARTTAQNTPRTRVLVASLLLAAAALQATYSLAIAVLFTFSRAETAMAVIPAALIMSVVLGTVLRKPGPSRQAVVIAAAISSIAYTVSYALMYSFIPSLIARDFSQAGQSFFYVLMMLIVLTWDLLVAFIICAVFGLGIRRVTTAPAPRTRYNRGR